MPIYEFESKAGKVVERFYLVDRRPSQIVQKGVVFKRIRFPRKVEVSVIDYECVSRSLPKWDQNHRANGGQFDKAGHPCFSTKQQTNYYHDQNREYVIYDR